MDDLICYCFGYTAEDVRRDVEENGRSLIMEKIMALSDVRRVVEDVMRKDLVSSWT